MCSPSFQSFRDTLKSKAAAQGTLQNNPASAAGKPMNDTMRKNLAKGGMLGAIMGQVLRSNGYDTTGTSTSSSSSAVAIQKKKTTGVSG